MNGGRSDPFFPEDLGLLEPFAVGACCCREEGRGAFCCCCCCCCCSFWPPPLADRARSSSIGVTLISGGGLVLAARTSLGRSPDEDFLPRDREDRPDVGVPEAGGGGGGWLSRIGAAVVEVGLGLLLLFGEGPCCEGGAGFTSTPFCFICSLFFSSLNCIQDLPCPPCPPCPPEFVSANFAAFLASAFQSALALLFCCAPPPLFPCLETPAGASRGLGWGSRLRCPLPASAERCGG